MSASRSRRPSGSSELTGSSRMQQPRLGDERLGDPEPLAHPAGVAGDPPLARRRRARPARASRSARGRASAAARPCSRAASSTSSRPVIQP